MIVTRYELWRHSRSREVWAVRLEHDTLTGVYGPLPETPAAPRDLSTLPYDDHPDDLEWIIRASEHFTVLHAH